MSNLLSRIFTKPVEQQPVEQHPSTQSDVSDNDQEDNQEVGDAQPEVNDDLQSNSHLPAKDEKPMFIVKDSSVSRLTKQKTLNFEDWHKVQKEIPHKQIVFQIAPRGQGLQPAYYALADNDQQTMLQRQTALKEQKEQDEKTKAYNLASSEGNHRCLARTVERSQKEGERKALANLRQLFGEDFDEVEEQEATQARAVQRTVKKDVAKKDAEERTAERAMEKAARAARKAERVTERSSVDESQSALQNRLEALTFPNAKVQAEEAEAEGAPAQKRRRIEARQLE